MFASTELRIQIEKFTTFQTKTVCFEMIDLTEVPKSTVYYLFSKYKRTAAVTNGKTTGRPRKLTWKEKIICQKPIQKLTVRTF